MAENKLIIGSLPVLRGAYDSATNYYRDNQVTMYGSTFQSLVDENVGYPPAELREDGKVYAINTDKWIIVANAIDAYNAGERIANAETRIKELGEYADSPEFIRVYTDANGKFLWGIRADGTVEWAKGVPTPVKEALRELESKINTDNNGKFEEIETSLVALQDAVDVINASLKPLTDTFSFQDSPEFVNVVTDADGKVLFGIKADGSPYYPNNEMYHVIQNDEYLSAWVDASNKILFGIKTDGSIYIAKSEYIDAVKEIQAKIASFSEDVQPLMETFSIVSNDEWLHAVVDAEGKFLFGIKAENGEVVMPKQDTYKVVSNDEWMAAWLDSQDRILFGVKADGTFYAAKHNFNINGGNSDVDEEIEEINATLSNMKGILDSLQKAVSELQIGNEAVQMMSVIDDAEERLAVTTDNKEKVLSYRDKDGVLHENKGFDTPKYYQDGKEKDFVDKSEVAGEVTKAAENGAVKLENVDGVSNHNTPNLLIADEMQKTFNDGKNSFTPPNAGYEMSNPIECKAGDWFTRTGTATGMVVVTDENDKNGTRLFNADGTTLGSTFQIPTDMTWVRYIRMAADVTGAENGTTVICRGKYAYIGENKGDYLTVSKLRIEKRNLSKEVAYIKSEDGLKFYELYVDSTGALKTREIDPDLIPESEYPTNWLPITFSGSFDGHCDRIPLLTFRYIMDIKAGGPTKILSFSPELIDTYNNFEHFYAPNGEGRYGCILFQVPEGMKSGLFLFDEDFNIIENNIGSGDMHDFVYISDEHVILFYNYTTTVNVQGIDADIHTIHILEKKKISGEWKTVGEFHQKDYPELCTECFGDMGIEVGSHNNTITLDYDGNLIFNQRNWDTFVKIKRTENEDGTVTLGSKTLDYDEAVIGRVGGRHNSAYINSKRVLNEGFSFTDVPTSLSEVSSDDWEEWQWFHSHDVKYWGMKNIGGQNYPTYTLFDNNMWTGDSPIATMYNVTNRNNNITINPNGAGGYYSDSYDSDEDYAKYTHSRVIQISIDWENHLIKDYRIYVIPKLYTQQQGGAEMLEEGVICIAYSAQGIFGIWDFTTEETEVQGHYYTGAKEVFKGQYDNYRNVYRANAYKLNNN